MDILKTEATQQTPELVFDADEYMLSIKGACRPEDAQVFFAPVFSWLDEFRTTHPKVLSSPLNIEVKLNYFNSASFLNLVEFFKKIQQIHQDGVKVLIEWYYDEDDDLIRETGQELSELSELPFIMIED